MQSGRTTALYGAPLISLLLLLCIWIERQAFHLPEGDSTAYHASVRAIAGRLPWRIGDWEGTKVDTPPAAVSMLKPNIVLGRLFRNRVTREHTTLMIIQCEDARDMGGHYPPVCYPAHGWTQREATTKEILVKGIPIPVTAYRFTRESIEEYSEIQIYNFFVRPDGSIESGREGVGQAAANPRMKHFGAGQVQMMFSPSMSEERMDEVFREIISDALPVLNAIRRGEVQ